MTPLLARLQEDLNAARKSQDKARVLLIGSIISDARNREIELKRDLTDDDVIDVFRRGIKRRRESIEMFDKGKARGIDTRGIIDHGFINSIYFRDPNGYVIELTAKTERHAAETDRKSNSARAKLDRWQAQKAATS